MVHFRLHISHHSHKCPTVAPKLLSRSRRYLVLSVYSQEVTACFTLPSVTNRLPDRWFIRCVITWKSLGHILSAGVVTDYGANVEMLGATIPNVLILRTVISIFDSLKKFSPGKGIFNNDWRKTGCHFLATDTLFLCGSFKIFAESLYFWEIQNA
jgi:hypothetical protein